MSVRLRKSFASLAYAAPPAQAHADRKTKRYTAVVLARLQVQACKLHQSTSFTTMSHSEGAGSYSRALKGRCASQSDGSGSAMFSQHLEIGRAESPCAASRLEATGVGLLWDTCSSTAGQLQKGCSYSEALKGERHVPLYGDTDASLHPLAIEPRHDTAAQEMMRVEKHPQQPDFYDLQGRLNVGDISSTWSPTEAGSEKSRSAVQIEKIVRMVKRRLPEMEEQEIYRHVVGLRKRQGGFSHMKLNSIVSLVLGHITNVVHGANSTADPTW